MILPALVRYYERAAADPESGLAAPGYSEQKISFAIELDDDGALRRIADCRVAPVQDGRGKSPKPRPRLMIVPGQSKPSGSGVNPCYFWDNAAYMLGYSADSTKADRARACFEAFAQQHKQLAEELDDPALHAICAFLDRWDPESFEPTAPEQETLAAFGVFRVGTEQRFVHERPAIAAWWGDQLDALAAEPATLHPSLLDGVPSPIARLHEPKIKNVRGAQSSGALLVSFNEDAFQSYSKDQGGNAPVAEADAFRYCTALNHLLADETRRAYIGDATVVWWAEAKDPAERADAESLTSLLFGTPQMAQPSGAAPQEDTLALDRVGAAMQQIARGRLPSDLPGAEAHVHVLGLSPNAARLAVRFWWQGPLVEILENLRQHHEDLRLEPVPDWQSGRPYTIHQLVLTTARVLRKGNQAKPDADTVPPPLGSALSRAACTGIDYPNALLSTLIRRIHSDGEVTHARCALVKACINRRRRRVDDQQEEVPVSLQPDGPVPYQLGRLFAVLEKVQEDALGDVGASIRDRFFASASATPATAFPRLVKLSQHHLGKLDTRYRIAREKLMQAIFERIDGYPSHLAMQDQGLFQIGYYHQRQDMFKKKKADAASEHEEA